MLQALRFLHFSNQVPITKFKSTQELLIFFFFFLLRRITSDNNTLEMHFKKEPQVSLIRSSHAAK